jgi:transcriptional regulator with XRE-family HTH domain
VSPKTYEYWERGRHEPEDRFFPGVVRFLGYDPSPAPVSLPERIRAKRRREGISQRELAGRLGLDPGTVKVWEAGAVVRPYPRIAAIFEHYVEGV